MNRTRRLLRPVKQRLVALLEERTARRLVRSARPLAARSRSAPAALVFTAAGPGSLGDEAMLVAAGHALRRRGITRQTVVSYGPGADWEPLGSYTDVLAFGERYRTAFWETCEELIGALADATHFLVLGADVMDGYYSPYEAVRRTIYTRLAHAAGVRAMIGGFSFNAAPHPRSVAVLSALPPAIGLIARDPVSHRRLTSRLDRPVTLGADLAFLLEPDTEARTVGELRPWLRAEKAAGRLLLGVNANYLVDPRHREADTGEALVQAYAAGLAEFARAHGAVSLVLVPHDYRRMAGRHDDLALLQAIAGRLPADLAEHVRVLEAPLTAAAAKATVGELDLVISGRMHLAIAALGSGVPAAGITYQGKFEGLYEHFGLSATSLAPEELFTPGALASFLGQMARRRQELAGAIGARLPQVREFAGANLRVLCGDQTEAR